MESVGGIRLGGRGLGAPNLTRIVIFPVSSMVTRSFGAVWGAFRFFQNGMTFSWICLGIIRFSRGRPSVLAGARGGVGGGDALFRWSGFARAKSDSSDDFPCLIHGDGFFGGVLRSVSLFPE